MKKIYSKINIITKRLVPHNKAKIFLLTLLFIGIISGAGYLTILSSRDKQLIVEKITFFISSLKTTNYGQALQNSIIINIGLIISIFILGFSIIGIPIIIIIIFFKGFITGFMIGSFIISLGIKGLISAIIYSLFIVIFDLLPTLLLSIYSLTIGWRIIRSVILKRNNNISNTIKKYIIIFLLCLVLAVINSLCETYLFIFFIKFITNVF